MAILMNDQAFEKIKLINISLFHGMLRQCSNEELGTFILSIQLQCHIHNAKCPIYSESQFDSLGAITGNNVLKDSLSKCQALYFCQIFTIIQE